MTTRSALHILPLALVAAAWLAVLGFVGWHIVTTRVLWAVIGPFLFIAALATGVMASVVVDVVASVQAGRPKVAAGSENT